MIGLIAEKDACRSAVAARGGGQRNHRADEPVFAHLQKFAVDGHLQLTALDGDLQIV